MAGDAREERARRARALLPQERLLSFEDVLETHAELLEAAARRRRLERDERAQEHGGRDDPGPLEERPGLCPVRDLGGPEDRRSDRIEDGRGEGTGEGREGREPRAGLEAGDDLVHGERARAALERERAGFLDEEEPLAVGADEERQRRLVRLHLKGMARPRELRVACPEELADLPALPARCGRRAGRAPASPRRRPRRRAASLRRGASRASSRRRPRTCCRPRGRPSGTRGPPRRALRRGPRRRPRGSPRRPR